MKTKENKDNKPNRTKFDEVYGLDYFYDNYHRKYPPKFLGKKKGIRPIKIDKSLYKLILMEYLDVYFKEIYFLSGKSYFLWTGTLQKVLYRPRTIKNIKKKIIGSTIGFLWENRPSNLFGIFVRFIKLTGSSNRLPKIEIIYKNNHDINLIANFEDVINKSRINKTLYE